MSRFKNKFTANTEVQQRTTGTRHEKKVVEDLPKIVFSLKDFDSTQSPPGQSAVDWQAKGYLSSMVEKLQQVSEVNIIEAQQQGIITIYGAFPAKSKFRVPKFMQETKESINWAVIKKVGGQKTRIAGHVIGNVFYIVFLDADHLFFPSEK